MIFSRIRERRKIAATFDAAMDVVVWEIRRDLLVYRNGERIATIYRTDFAALIEQMARELGKGDTE